MRLLVIVGAMVTGVVAAFALAGRRSYRRFVANAHSTRAAVGVQSTAVVTELDLEGLPEPLTRYVRFSGMVGKPRISTVHLTHAGSFKAGLNKPWLPIKGEYFITTRKPTFSWHGRLRMPLGLSVAARDSYADGRGRMLVRLMSAFTIVDDQSDQVTRSAFGRCIAELAVMAPSFLLDRAHVRCVQTGRDTVRCTVTDGALSSDADLMVHADGSLDRVVVMRYFDRGGGRATLERFTGQSSRPKSYSGIVLGSKLDGCWNLAEGDLHYVSFDVVSVEFH